LIISALTRAELLAFLAAARAARERDWLLFAVMHNHALRVSEAVGDRYRDRKTKEWRELPGLLVSDISEHGIRIVGLKGGETVTQPLIAHPEPLLNEQPALLKGVLLRFGSEKVFKIGRRQVWELMQRYGERANIPPEKRHPHALRHTCGKWMARQMTTPEGIKAVQAWMRHQDLGSTGIYLELSQEEVNAAVLPALGAETGAL